MDRVLSGMQPSGYLHLGNLMGALRNWVNLQDRYECYYFVADWHSLTTNYTNPSVIKEFTEDLVLNFLAAGLDPERCTIFIQSKILEHAEFHVLLSMITPLGWLERVPSYKEKKEEIKDRDIGTYGFLGYPVLQSADILIYRARYVPVGVDQVPHLEITREIARRFNFLYNSDVLVEPEPLLTEFPKVTGLDGRKMSKSYDNAVYLNDPPEVVRKKILTMVTDVQRVKRTDPGDPDKCPAYELHRVFSSEEQLRETEEGCRTAGIGCIDCKRILLGNVFKILEPIWRKRQELKDNPEILREIVIFGIERAKRVAGETMVMVRETFGMS